MDHVREIKLAVALSHINEYALLDNIIELHQHFETKTLTTVWVFADSREAQEIFDRL